MSVFPHGLSLSGEQVEEVVRLAGAAPSLHNRQPWRFRVLPELIELHADPARALPATDPEGRELRLGCGAALLNLRMGLEHFGVRPTVTLFPRMAFPTVLAEVRRGGAVNQDAQSHRLFRAIPQRRTNRKPFLPTPVPSDHRHALVAAARVEGCWLHVIGGAERGPLEGLVRRAHREQMADARFRAEWSKWTGRAEGAREGVPTQAAGPRPEQQDQWVVRDYSGGLAQPRVPGKDFESDPCLVVLCSYQDGKYDGLRAGQALQRVLLAATARGLAVSLLSQVVEVEQTRTELRRMLGGSLRPQAVLRVGYGSPTPPVPRRSPEELLMNEGGNSESAGPGSPVAFHDDNASHHD